MDDQQFEDYEFTNLFFFVARACAFRIYEVVTTDFRVPSSEMTNLLT